MAAASSLFSLSSWGCTSKGGPAMAAAEADDDVGGWLQWTQWMPQRWPGALECPGLWSADGCPRDAGPPEGCRGSSEALKAPWSGQRVLRRPSAPLPVLSLVSSAAVVFLAGESAQSGRSTDGHPCPPQGCRSSYCGHRAPPGAAKLASFPRRFKGRAASAAAYIALFLLLLVPARLSIPVSVPIPYLHL